MMALFGVNVVIALIALIVILFITVCRWTAWTKPLHLIWCILGLSMVCFWTLGALLYPVSVVLMETCGVLDKIFNYSAFFTRTFNIFFEENAEATDTLFTCIYGDGNILGRFNLTDQFALFDSIFDSIGNTSDLFGSNVPDSIVIPIHQDTCQPDKNRLHP